MPWAKRRTKQMDALRQSVIYLEQRWGNLSVQGPDSIVYGQSQKQVSRAIKVDVTFVP